MPIDVTKKFDGDIGETVVSTIMNAADYGYIRQECFARGIFRGFNKKDTRLTAEMRTHEDFVRVLLGNKPGLLDLVSTQNIDVITSEIWNLLMDLHCYSTLKQ